MSSCSGRWPPSSGIGRVEVRPVEPRISERHRAGAAGLAVLPVSEGGIWRADLSQPRCHSTPGFAGGDVGPGCSVPTWAPTRRAGPSLADLPGLLTGVRRRRPGRGRRPRPPVPGPAWHPEPVRDPYAVLGLEPPATAEEVRAAYRARSMLLHPDLHEGRPARVRTEAERAMAQLTEAYETLTGPGAGAGGRRAGSPPAPPGPTALYRLGRLLGRSGAAGRGSYAFRLGRLVGRHRPR